MCIYLHTEINPHQSSLEPIHQQLCCCKVWIHSPGSDLNDGWMNNAEIEFYMIFHSFIQSSYSLGTTKAAFENAGINQSLAKVSNHYAPHCFKYIHISRASLTTAFLLLLCCFSMEHPLHAIELDAQSTDHLLQQQVVNCHLNKENLQVQFITQELEKQKLFFHMLLQLRQPTLPSSITYMTEGVLTASHFHLAGCFLVLPKDYQHWMKLSAAFPVCFQQVKNNLCLLPSRT